MGAVIYSGCNYTGKAYQLQIDGNYQNLSGLNGSISLKISTGLVVTLYNGPNYTGNSLMLTTSSQTLDIPCLLLSNWVNGIQSVKVIKNNSTAEGFNMDTSWITYLLLAIIFILIILYYRNCNK